MENKKKFKNTRHSFKYYGLLNERKIFRVKCSKTGGEFSTALWDLEKLPRNVCACCKGVIKNGE